MDRLQRLQPIALLQFWTNPKRVSADRFPRKPELFRYEATTELEIFHLYAIRRNAISVSSFANPKGPQSVEDRICCLKSLITL